jgi:hypothetical protein
MRWWVYGVTPNLSDIPSEENGKMNEKMNKPKVEEKERKSNTFSAS